MWYTHHSTGAKGVPIEDGRTLIGLRPPGPRHRSGVHSLCQNCLTDFECTRLCWYTVPIATVVNDQENRYKETHASGAILGILFAVFVSLFALDVFDVGYSFWETVFALGMHLIPTGILLVALILSWRWEWLGGILFLALGMLYLVAARGQHWSAYVAIAGPLFLESVLFLLSWRYRVTPQHSL